MMRTVDTVSILVLATVLGALGATPATGAATGITEATVTPSTATTGDATTISVSLTVEGVDTSDGTTDGSVTLSVPDAVNLAKTRATNVSVGPNASTNPATIDADAGTVTVTWDDDAGTPGENLSISLDLEGIVVGRTGGTIVTAVVDADATGGAEVTTTVGTITAIASGSDRSVTETPATLYLGEHDVDLTAISGINPAGSSQSFYGVSGEAEGGIAQTEDTLKVDLTAANGFETGGYAFESSAETLQVSVVRPRVSDIEISPGATVSTVNVANKSISRGTSELTVGVDTNFEEAENVTIAVVDDDDLDVTEQLTDSPTVTSNAGSVTLNVSSLDTGLYEVTAEGSDDLDTVSRTVTFRVRDSEKVISLSKTRVTRGESTIVTVAGEPGAVRYVRISATTLREGAVVNTPTARSVFDDTEAVQAIGADSDLGIVYAVVALDDDGLADLRLQSEKITTGSVDVELAERLAGTSEDEAELEVFERRLTISDPQRTVIGEILTISGTAVESNRVKLYAVTDGSYVPLYTDEAELAEPEVANDGTWESEIETNRVINLPGTYRIAAVADPGSAQLGSTESIDSQTFRMFEIRSTTSVEMVTGALTADISRNEIAATGDDEVSISGTAVGQGDSIRVYLIGPRGRFLGTDGTAGQVESIDIEADRFNEEYDAFDTRGKYTFLIIGKGRDGEYASDYGFDGNPLQSELASQQAVEIISDEYTGAGVDDQIIELTLEAESPSLTVNDFTTNGQVATREVTVSGTSNRERGTVIFIEILSDNHGVIASSEAEVNGSNGTWSTKVDLSAVETGGYTLHVKSGGLSTSLEFEFVESIDIATRTTTRGPDSELTTQPTETPVEEPTEATTREPSETPATSTSMGGFGVSTVFIALWIMMCFAARRR